MYLGWLVSPEFCVVALKDLVLRVQSFFAVVWNDLFECFTGACYQTVGGGCVTGCFGLGLK